MASDAESRKRALEIAFADAADTTICSHCSQRFDEAERAPRVLTCGHTFCTVCLGALVQKQNARKWAIACPFDNQESPVDKGDVKTLSKNDIAVKVAKIAAASQLMRLFIRNLAGVRFPLIVVPDDTIAAAKKQFEDEHPEYPAHLQVWSMTLDHTSSVLEDARTVGSYALESGGEVGLVVLDGFRGGAFVRSFGEKGSGAGQLNEPSGICISSDGALLCVCDNDNERVQLLRASDFAHVRTIDLPNEVDDEDDIKAPYGACFSADNVRLYVADFVADRVQVFRVSDGAHIHTIGDVGQYDGPNDVRVSPNGELLFVSDAHNKCVHVHRLSDGAPLRSISLSGANVLQWPSGLCLSPDGELLFVADKHVQVFRVSDGSHVRTIEFSAKFSFSQRVCLSPSGEWLFVTDQHSCRVHVLRASDGVRMHSIVAPGGGDVLSYDDSEMLNNGICVSPNGERLFLVDSMNNCVHVFALND